MQLSPDELSGLRDDGFTVVRDVLPGRLCENARRRINKYLATINMSEEGPNYQFMGELSESDEMLDLYHHTPVKALAESLIGQEKVEPYIKAQMALRFPTGNVSAPQRQSWHMDSFLRCDGGELGSGPSNFTLLMGFCLSDMSTPDRGNFTVRPGGHRVVADYFRKAGIEHFDDALSVAHERLEFAPPHQVCAKAGDVIFCHHQVPHNPSENLSGDIRYMFFIRLRRVGREHLVREAVLDPFHEWDGMPREAAASAKA